MKKYTFTIKNNPTTYYTPSYKSTDYSKVLDDLINADIKDKNPWLFTTSTTCKATCPFNNICTPKINITDSDDIITTACKTLEYEDNLKKAFKFFANYNLGGFCPYKMNKLYKINDDIKFMILIDGILINDKMFFYDDFNNLSLMNALSANMKKTIATIYVDGLKITIKK